MNQNQIKTRLTLLGKTQSWLAVEAGMSQTYINHLTMGRIANPTVRTAFKIAEALGCSVEDLFSVNGQPEKEEDWI